MTEDRQLEIQEMRHSRAERKKQIYHILASWDKKKKGATMNTGMIARRLGLVSSSHLVSILKEMEREGLIRALSTAPNSRYGYVFRVWQLVRWEQMELPSDTIIINGTRFIRSELEAV